MSLFLSWNQHLEKGVLSGLAEDIGLTQVAPGLCGKELQGL